jgi:hypothetical protein
MPTGIYVRTAEKFLLRALHSVLNSNIKCSIAGCFNPPRGNYRTGVCEMHYTMVMFLPPREQYVNIHKNCFHLHQTLDIEPAV